MNCASGAANTSCLLPKRRDVVHVVLDAQVTAANVAQGLEVPDVVEHQLQLQLLLRASLHLLAVLLRLPRLHCSAEARRSAAD